ncbi:MAG TPA: MYXO-CTERM sorting domain-containing protein, partial [Polyangia bacterium]|nr:MYXO-CTERM sorting domain-containing protein [Polyangia bacterium]
PMATATEAGANTTVDGYQYTDVTPLRNYNHVAVCGDHAHHHHYCKARMLVDSNNQPLRFDPRAGGSAGGFTASDLQNAYKLDVSRNPGATVAVVDAYGYSQAESDLAGYRSANGLPACSVASGCLTIVNQEGKTSPLPSAPPSNDDWTVETALDLDMASAACPNCKIILVQANTDQDDGLDLGQQVAATLGASVISNSWGGADATGSDSTSGEQYFQITPAINIFVAAGDDAYDDGATGADYPSTSAYAIGVGGTSLTISGGTRSETAWSDGGSSCSLSIPKPSYQAAVLPDSVCKFRAASDVAAVADPNTGVNVYNKGSMQVVGGTSAASPFVAGVYALYGFSKQDVSFAYVHAAAFNDVTSGSNAVSGKGGKGGGSSFSCTSGIMCTAGVGWDGPTGVGTPNGTNLGMLATGPDMAIDPPDMAIGPDMAQPTGTGGNGGGTGEGGGTGSAGGGGTSSGGGTGQAGGSGNSNFGNGCGCTLGGAQTGNGLLALPLGLLLLGLAIYRRRRA